MENPQTVEMVTTYTKHSDGRITEKRMVGQQVIYEGPSPVVFMDFPSKLPWNKDDDYEQVTGG